MACLVLPQAKAFKEFETGDFAGDDHFSVDRLVQSCQPKSMPALPSAGRELVPYFSSPGDCVNETLTQTKTDTARKRKKSSKKSLTTSADSATLSTRQISPGKPVTKRVAQKQPEYTAGSSTIAGSSAVNSKRPQAPSLCGAATGKAKCPLPLTCKDLKAWAGPSYCNSPAPEHLPMPTLFLLAV